MNDESDNLTPDTVGKLLDDVVPAAPSTAGWAATASGRVRRRRWLTGATVAVALALAVPAGIQLFGDRAVEAVPQPADSSAGPDSSEPPAPGGPVELVGSALLLQAADDEGPNLCWGMAESLPPQCSGPTLLGNFSWDDVDHEDVSGVRWTNDVHTLYGFLDLEAGEQGTFTVSRPVATVAPSVTDPVGMDFPQLCDDMLVDADPARAGVNDQDRLHAALQELPVVGTWVSDGVAAFNVRVQGDADATFGQLRTVWGGKLCVESSEAPTEAERQAAMDRVWDTVPPAVLHGGDAGTGIDPTVSVSVLVATPEVEAAIRDAVGDMDVRITAVFTPVEDSTGPVDTPTSTASAVPSSAGTVTPKGSPTEPASTATASELRAHGAIVQRPGEEPVLCLDGVTWSWIPGCVAPLPLVGLVWDDIQHSDRDGTLVVDSAVVRGILAEDASSFTVTGVEQPGSSMPTALPPALETTAEQQDAAVERIQVVLPAPRLAVENWASSGHAEGLGFVSVRLAEYNHEVIAAIEMAAGPDVSVRVTTILTPVDLDPSTLINFGDWGQYEEGDN